MDPREFKVTMQWQPGSDHHLEVKVWIRRYSEDPDQTAWALMLHKDAYVEDWHGRPYKVFAQGLAALPKPKR